MSKPSLQLRQGQSLVMTEQLQQSIKLLQLTSMELAEFIEQELEKNPLLSVEEPDVGNDSEGSKQEREEEGAKPGEQEEGLYTQSLDMGGDAADANSGKGGEIDASNDDIWGGELESQRYEMSGAGGASGSESGFLSDTIEQTLSEAASLKDHLQQQVQLDIPNPVQRMIAVFLIDLLDENGYLREDISKLHEQLGAEKEDVLAALTALQQCDPAGVAARSLEECLGLQLKERGLLSRPMQVLLEHLDALADADMKKLKRLCGVDDGKLMEMVALLRTLDPRPGSHFSSEQVETLVPDVLVRKIGKDWRVDLNSDVLPRLLVNRQYYTQLSSRSRNREEKKFLNEQLANANWLLKALDQRAQSLLKVSSEIVRQQSAFLEHGIRHLKPLTLRHIAEEVEVHDSTVSRVTSGKYMATPRGVYPMKYFFSSALSDAGDGEGTSSRTVMHMIKELVDAEPASKILSDDKIAELLQRKGIDVARRTVVKYRQQMKIPSSVERRREKRKASGG